MLSVDDEIRRAISEVADNARRGGVRSFEKFWREECGFIEHERGRWRVEAATIWAERKTRIKA